MWKRQTLLTKVLQLSLLKSNKAYPVLGAQLIKSAGQFRQSIFPCYISHNFSTQSDSVRALFELGKDDEAFSSIKKGLSIDPLNQGLHGVLIDRFLEKNRLEDLKSFSKEVIEMIADLESISSFYLTSAEVLVKHEMFPQALLAYREAMKNDPPMSSRLYYKYAEILQHEGHYEEALAQFEQFKKGPKPNENQGFFLHYLRHANNGAAYMDYCLGRVQKAKEVFEKMIAEEAWAPLAKWNYLLILCHLGDEKMINHYKKNEFEGWLSLSEGNKWSQFYAQELKNTLKILERSDIDEETRKFNARKLEALNALTQFLRKRLGDEPDPMQMYSW